MIWLCDLGKGAGVGILLVKGDKPGQWLQTMDSSRGSVKFLQWIQNYWGKHLKW